VVAFGGGSALDVGKACRLFIKRPELKLARFNFNDDWNGMPRCLCIPTTAGTGSELARTATLRLAGTSRRAVIFLPRLLPKLVILDPELTVGLPDHLTAATGIDALTHCIESFTSPAFHPMCDGIALEGIHLLAQNLLPAFRDGENLAARSGCLMAAAMGGVASQKDLGAVHSLAHPLTAMFGVHHGLANALCLPHVMQFNAERKPGLYQRIGIACGLDVLRGKPPEVDRAVITWVRKLLTDLRLTGGLAARNVPANALDDLATQALSDPCHATNPVPLSWADLKALYAAAM
jgi:alcohol dehydrogenase class IV